jgi:hypothetical protein
MSEHSKLPWKVVRIGKDTIITDADGVGIDYKAEAEFIVKATANHEALKAALETLYVCAKNGYRIQPEDIEAAEKALESAK